MKQRLLDNAIKKICKYIPNCETYSVKTRDTYFSLVNIEAGNKYANSLEFLFYSDYVQPSKFNIPSEYSYSVLAETVSTDELFLDETNNLEAIESELVNTLKRNKVTYEKKSIEELDEELSFLYSDISSPVREEESNLPILCFVGNYRYSVHSIGYRYYKSDIVSNSIAINYKAIPTIRGFIKESKKDTYCYLFSSSKNLYIHKIGSVLSIPLITNFNPSSITGNLTTSFNLDISNLIDSLDVIEPICCESIVTLSISNSDLVLAPWFTLDSNSTELNLEISDFKGNECKVLIAIDTLRSLLKIHSKINSIRTIELNYYSTNELELVLNSKYVSRVICLSE